jgi:very-short-patch-repair endonuclease
VPQPLTNAAVALDGGHYEPDFLWPDRRLIVETDGFEAHRTRAAFVRDRRRDRRLRRAGYAVERFSWDDIFFDPRGCTEELRDILSRHPPRGGVDRLS